MGGSNRVIITGLGCICSLGDNVAECAKKLFEKRKEPAPPARFHSSHTLAYPVFQVAGRLTSPCLQLPHGISRTNMLALTAASQALKDAGLLPVPEGLRVGVCIGSTVGNALDAIDFYHAYLDNQDPDMAPISRFLSNNPAFVTAREFGLSGPCQTIANACSSGTDAIGIAAGWIRAGICDVAIAGGADELSRVTYNGFVSLMVTDEHPCRPFDLNRKGLNLGEGAAMLVLRKDNADTRKGGRIHGFVSGYGAACDAYHLTAPHPDGNGLRKAIHQALAESRKGPSDIAFVNAHGSGTRDNDRVESTVLNEMLRDVPFFSTKGHTGHALGAAGAIEAVLTVMNLNDKRVPASAGYESPDPDLPAAPTSETQAITGTTAISQSLAFGGNNSVIVLESADA